MSEVIEAERTVVLIDGDVIAYRCCEDRWRRPVSNPEELRKIFGEQFDKFMILSGETEFSDEENEAYLFKTYAIFKEMVAELKEMHFAEEVRVAVAGEDNFRKAIYPEYKMNRHADHVPRNPFVPLIREMAAEEGIAIQAHGMEADDLIRIWANELEQKNVHYVICSVDKDLKMIPGLHYLIHKREHFTSTPEFALRFYYQQLLMGDATDNIDGAPGIGPIKAEALLKDCETEEDFRDIVVNTYYSLVHQWRYALDLTGKLIYIKKTHDDVFDLNTWKIPVLCDIIDKPKKSKPKVYDFTIASALAAVNPRSVTTKQKWDAAMMFLVEAAEGAEIDIFEQVEVLSTRDEIPPGELEAYAKLQMTMMTLATTTPEELTATEPPPKLEMPFPNNLPITAEPDLEYTPILSSAPPPALPLSFQKVAEKLELNTPATVTEEVTVEVKKHFAIPEFKTAAVELPTFNPAWGKKK